MQHQEAVAKLNRHLASPNDEHFIFLLVMMPRKQAAELHQLHFLAIELRDNLRSSMLLNHCEFLAQRGFGHTVCFLDLLMKCSRVVPIVVSLASLLPVVRYFETDAVRVG